MSEEIIGKESDFFAHPVVAGTEAKPGDSIGVKVSERVRSGDLVYKITD